MATDNSVTLVGNLTDDPELRFTPQGVAVANFRIAVNQRRKDAQGNWVDGETSYFRISCWRQLAENVAETLTRGSRAIVTGQLKYREWESQEGEKRSVVEIDAQEVGPSLRFATAKIEKVSRSGGTGGGGASSGGDWDAGGAPPSDDVRAVMRKAACRTLRFQGGQHRDGQRETRQRPGSRRTRSRS